MKKTLLCAAVLCLTACVKIEAPEHLVSDTVEVGKDAYHAVKNKMSARDDADAAPMFSHRYVIAKGETSGAAIGKCVDGAVEKAKRGLNADNIVVTTATANPVATGEYPALDCSVTVAY